MQVLKKQPTVKAPAETFTGDAWFDVIARRRGTVAYPRERRAVAPGARNAWHAHSVGQTVHVTGRRRAHPGPRREGHRDPPGATRSTRLPASGTGTALRPIAS